jgi:hypothetical protein
MIHPHSGGVSKLATVEQLTERILYWLSLDMKVRALAERLLRRFFRFPNATTSYAVHASHSPGDAQHASPAGHPPQRLTKRREITEPTKLNVKDCSLYEDKDG